MVAAHGFKRRRFAWWCCGWRMELGTPFRFVWSIGWESVGVGEAYLVGAAGCGSWWDLVNFQRTDNESRDLQVFGAGVRRCGGASAGGEMEKRIFQTLTTLETLVGGLYTMSGIEY